VVWLDRRGCIGMEFPRSMSLMEEYQLRDAFEKYEAELLELLRD
jgi:hypothetical protein